MEANRLGEAPRAVARAGPHSLRQGPGAVDEFVSSGGPLPPHHIPPPTRQRYGLHEQLFAASMYDQDVATMKERPLSGGRLGMNCNSGWQHPRPFLYDVLCSTPLANADFVRTAYFPGTAACIISAYILAYAIPIAISVVLKRRSARPGGRLYQYNQRKVHQTISDKRRQIRDMINDPVLVRDMERRYGDLSSLREKVQDWESDDFQIEKEECAGKISWLREMNVSLVLIDLMLFYFEMNCWTAFIMLASFAHFVDNLLIQRAANKRWGGGEDDRKPSDKKIVAAVGVPVPEAEVGVPLERV
ncbi:hypothetical protein ACHAXT_003550 [Thalassiosira profunda]